MKTKSLFVAAVAIMMAACSETDNISVQNTAQQAETAVSFDTYTAKALTRAGAPGEIITKEDLQVNSFGVFAYYSNGTTYTAGTSKPDFMWNQKVEYDGDNWFYFPVKYWPNETNEAGDDKYVDAADPTENHATTTVTTAPDVVSFFAYAPYVEASTAGAVTPNNDGITGILSLNNVASDPILSYATPVDPLKTVDLLWGVVPSFKTKYATVLGDQTGLTAGLPNYNLIKQKDDERIMFQFKHALAKLTLDVKGFFDDVPEHGAHSETNDGDASDQSENNVAKDTKIVVEYVKLSTDKYSMASQLNLNNTTANVPLWDQDATDAADPVSFTISGSQLANLIRYRTPSAPERGYAEQPRGVTKDAVALLANDASQEAFYGIIPQIVSNNDDELWTVEVKYHVFTKDANLENGYSEITNVIKKDNIDMTFEAGKHYTLQLRLGMTTVKFDATVEDWLDGNTTPADLPINVAVKSVDNGTFTATKRGLANYNDEYTDAKTGAFGDNASALNLENISYTLSVSDVDATLVNGDDADATGSAEAVTIGTDVDWIKPVYNSADEKWELVVTENLTSATRTGKIWATYGGVDSEPVTVTQNGSDLKLGFYYTTGGFFEKTVAWDNMGTYPFEMSARYVDQANSSAFIDYSADAYSTGIFSHENWISVDPSAKTISVLSKNEDEVNDRVSNISFSYGGKTCEPITLTQSKKTE